MPLIVNHGRSCSFTDTDGHETDTGDSMDSRKRNWRSIAMGAWMIASTLWVGAVGAEYIQKRESGPTALYPANVYFFRDFAVPALLGPGLAFGLGAGLFLIIAGARRKA